MTQERYTPERFDKDHWKILIETRHCPLCGVEMVVVPMKAYDDSNVVKRLFRSDWWMNSLPDQLNRIGVRFMGNTRDMDTDEFICEQCEKEGKGRFTCALCGKVHPSPDEQESFGAYPPEYLCKTCYATVPAEQWDKKVEQLNRKHQYDFE